MADPSRIDRLLDAIDLVKADRWFEAQAMLRELIREDNNFEDAWLWMSVAVESLDQSAVCLDNVLRVNPHNVDALSALVKIRAPEIERARLRSRLRFYRDLTLGLLWSLAFLLLAWIVVTWFY